MESSAGFLVPRRPRVVRPVVAAGGCLLLAACGAAAQPPAVALGEGEQIVVALSDADAVPDVVSATWRAGFAALAAGEDDAGAVVSPASLVVALSMLAEGASGASAEALDAAVGATGQARTDAVGALAAELARFEGDPALVAADELPQTPMVHLANQVVVDDGVQANPEYLDALMAGYGAGVLVTDLSGPAGKGALDAWVREHSGGLVEESAITPDPLLVLVLQNAVALAAAWHTPFDPDVTVEQSFDLADGTTVDVPTMHGRRAVGYAEVEGWRAVRLPYLDADGGEASLWADVLLPPAGSAQAADPASADPALVARLTAALDQADPTEVQLALPTVDLATSLDLKPVLVDLGLGGLLSPETADLDRLLLDPPGPPYLGQAVQQAVLKVDEDGTRAAAVTEFGAMAGSAPVEAPVELIVDRPYLVAIQDGASGWPLFLAAVLDPRG